MSFFETIYDLFLWVIYYFKMYFPILFVISIAVVASMIWFGSLDATYITSISDGRPAIGIIIYPKLGVMP